MKEGYQEIVPTRVHAKYCVSSVFKKVEEGEVKITFFSNVKTSDYPVEYDNFCLLDSGSGKFTIITLKGSSKRQIDKSRMTFEEFVYKFEIHLEALMASGEMDFYEAMKSFEV